MPLNVGFILGPFALHRCGMHDRLTITPNRSLTITSRVLLKRNYNSMNQTLIAIIVKIRGSIFTIPRRFVDLLWRVTARADLSFVGSCRFVSRLVSNPVPV